MSDKLFKLFAWQLIVSIFITPLAGLSVHAETNHRQNQPATTLAAPPPPTSIDLSTYVRVGRHNLPEPTRTTAPANSLLAQEASAVTYNWDTDSLFVVGDGGTSVVQVTKTGQLIDSMTLATGSSPQGTEFYDPEGLSYVGSGKFVMSEERDRQIVQFTYAAGTTLRRANSKTVKLGTFVQNIGIEGLSWDPMTSGYICVKETLPQGVFQTGINFDAGTATNGSPTTENSTNLFNPALANLADLADVFALSNLPSLNGQPDSDNLLLLSQESGKVVNIDRNGAVSSSLTIVSDPGNPLSVAAQQHEGLTMDRDGVLYIINENGGGDFDHPQLWVYAPSLLPNQAPTAVSLNNATTSIVENTSTASAIKLADVIVSDDGLGTNSLSITGVDASFFEVIGTSLFLKAGTVLDFETKSSYNITINVDDTSLGNTPDASVNYTLTVTDQNPELPPVPTLIISEIAPWSSGNSPVVAADWFEVTNTGTTAVDLTGWTIDDSSNSVATSVPLSGVNSIAPGESVIFLEATNDNPAATVIANFKSVWFGSNIPATLQVGTYQGGGVGLSTGGDAVNLYNSAGALQANVSFGNSPAGPSFPSFDNWGGLNNATVSQLSVVGVHDAFVAAGDANEIGSPGSAGRIIISEVAPWSSGSSPINADWFELTNTRATTVNITGWKIDDSSGSPAAAVALNGVTTIGPGESVVFVESNSGSISGDFKLLWFGATTASVRVGSYSGDGVGLGTGGDALNIYNASGVVQASVIFGASTGGPAFATFDNAAGLNATTISLLSAVGVNGAFVAASDPNEVGSPGVIAGSGPTPTPTPTPTPSPSPSPSPAPAVSVRVTEVAPWSSGTAVVAADWFELTNTGSTAVDLTGWKVDDNSNSAASGVPLSGVASVAPGESVIFLEASGSNPPATVIANFKSVWFGGNPPAGLKIGTYQGSGIGLGTGGDAVNLFDSLGALQANVVFGASPAGPSFPSFDNAAGLNNATISQLSVSGTNGAFAAVNDANEIGSPGWIANVTRVRITEVAPWSSGTAVVAADWFELTNTGNTQIDLTGWKIDDNSNLASSAVPLSGIASLAAGESAIFLEASGSNPAATVIANFKSVWFGATPPAGLKVGTYQGSGVGLGTGGDAVNIYDSTNVLQANVSFGASPAGPSFPTFDNAAGSNNSTISQLSFVGASGAFLAVNDSNQIGSPGTITPAATTVEFTFASTTIPEGTATVNVTVARTGVTTGTSTVRYATNDSAASPNCSSNLGRASSRCDFLTRSGTLTFAPGETSKTISISIVDDAYAESAETFTVDLTNPTGAALGVSSVVTLQIDDNEVVNGTNPIDSAAAFVRMHYLDFLNREPDTAGLNFWVNEITSCGADTQCLEVKKVNVSAAFFLSIEFQETGYFAYRIYKSSFGNIAGTSVPVRYVDFLSATQKLGENLQVGVGDWQTVLENNKRALASTFVQRADFIAAFPNSLTAEQFVNQLDVNAGGVLSVSEKADLVAQLGATPADSAKRALVLRAVSDDTTLRTAELNRAFVLLQYFGYLRRNPNDAPDADYSGFNFWLNKLDSFGGNFVNAELVKAFIISGEYRQRFGP